MRLPPTVVYEIRHSPRLLSLDELERIAALVHRLAGSGNAEAIALALGIVIRIRRGLREGLDGAMTPWGDIDVRPMLTGRKRRLVILHEIAHILLASMHPTTHTHADVWMLTLYLATSGAIFSMLMATANEGDAFVRILQAISLGDG